MNEIFTYMITYAVLLGLFIGLVQWLSNGFFFIMVRVKASRGKKLVVEVRSKLETYSVIGKIEEGFLIYKDRPASSNKIVKRIAIPEGAVFRKYNLNFIKVDEEHNNVIMPNETFISGFDAIKHEGLNIRALQSTIGADFNKILRILTIVVIVLIIAVLISNFRVHELSKLVEGGSAVVGVIA